MATISASFLSPSLDASPINEITPTYNAIGSWGNGNFTFDFSPSSTTITTTVYVSSTTILYRGFSGGNYVYSYDVPPVGATDIVRMN